MCCLILSQIYRRVKLWHSTPARSREGGPSVTHRQPDRAASMATEEAHRGLLQGERHRRDGIQPYSQGQTLAGRTVAGCCKKVDLIRLSHFSAVTAFMLMQTGWIQASHRVSRRLA